MNDGTRGGGADDAPELTESEVLHALVNVRGRELARRLFGDRSIAPADGDGVRTSLGGPLTGGGSGSLLTVEHQDGYAVLAFAGELDVNTSASLRDELARLIADGPVVVDLRRVTFLDSMGLGALIAAQQRAGRQHRLPIVLDPGQQAVRRLFEITNLDRMFALCSTMAEASQCAAAGA